MEKLIGSKLFYRGAKKDGEEIGTVVGFDPVNATVTTLSIIPENPGRSRLRSFKFGDVYIPTKEVNVPVSTKK